MGIVVEALLALAYPIFFSGLAVVSPGAILLVEIWLLIWILVIAGLSKEWLQSPVALDSILEALAVNSVVIINDGLEIRRLRIVGARVMGGNGLRLGSAVAFIR